MKDDKFLYDVFLSHNRKQSQWVKCLYQFLTMRGLRVFYDEISIPPGAKILPEIEKALTYSKYFLLVLSPASISSKWVAIETEWAAYTNCAEGINRLIPILIQPINLNEIPLMVRTLNIIDFTSEKNREDRLRSLLSYIGITDVENIMRKDLLSLLSMPITETGMDLQIAGINEVLDWGWDGVKLLDEFIKLDYITLDNLTQAYEGDSYQWAPIFMNHPDTWRMLINEPQKIVGYWHYAPLFSADYEIAKKGMLLDSQITGDKVRFFELPGRYDIYFVQICLHPQFRKPRHIRLLFESVFGVLDSLSNDKIFIREICANAYTKIGHSLCKSFNLQYICEHSGYGSIYGGSIKDILVGSNINVFPNLRKRYMEEGLI